LPEDSPIWWKPASLRNRRKQQIILETVAGPQMAHLAKIAAAFEVPELTLTVPGLPKIPKSFALLTSFTIWVHLNCRF
jgi:hypothetical protein